MHHISRYAPDIHILAVPISKFQLLPKEDSFSIETTNFQFSQILLEAPCLLVPFSLTLALSGARGGTRVRPLQRER